MSRLLENQQDFAQLVPKLINKALELGYKVTLGDAYRNPAVYGELGEAKVPRNLSHPRSAHKARLAVDLNLFRFGVLVQTTEGHLALGEWWEKQDARCRWGGRFNDGNHYSFEWNGVR